MSALWEIEMDTTADKRLMLIVDDMTSNRLLLKRIFRSDYNILEAADGVQALKLLRSHQDISVLVLDIVMPNLDGIGVLAEMQRDERLKDIPTVVVTASDDDETQINALNKGATDVLTKPFSPQIMFHRVKNIIARKEADRLAEENRAYQMELRLTELDERTGLNNKYAFIRRAARVLRENPGKQFVLARWDIDNFKVYNECFGTEMGDEYLRKVGAYYLANADKTPGLHVVARYDADHFITLRSCENFDPEGMLENIDRLFSEQKTVTFEYKPRMGLYYIEDSSLDVPLMCDRALLALRSTKDSYSTRFAWYDDSIRRTMIEEQEIVNETETALKSGQFVVYLQPQYDHDSDMLVGAEALVRWAHPTKGLIPPFKFLPLFERNGFISQLDSYIWESVCALLRKWLDAGLKPVPVSVNISRRDIFSMSLGDVFAGLLTKYRLSPSLLHLEITETLYTQNAEQLTSAVNALRNMGMQVHMDDFGSGYSSLNMLRTVAVDVLKLDMNFLSGTADDDKSGSILNAIIRMADALKLPVLAEGVETQKQADMLMGIGCYLMQGYYFAKPMPIADFEKLLTRSDAEDSGIDILGVFSHSEMVFDSMIGGAALIKYIPSRQEARIMRINDKCLTEMSIVNPESMHSGVDLLDTFEGENRSRVIDMFERAYECGREVSCEALSKHDNNSRTVWLRLRSRLTKRNSRDGLYFVTIENINESKLLELNNADLLEKLTAVVNNVPGGVLNLMVTADDIKITYVSDKCANMAGYSKDEYVKLFGGDMLRLIHPADIEHLKASMKSLAKDNNSIFTETCRHACLNGDWHWVKITGQVFRREHGTAYVSAIAMDVNTSVEQDNANKLLSVHNRLLSGATNSIAFDYDPSLDRMTFTMNALGAEAKNEVFERYVADFQNDDRIAAEDRAKHISALMEASVKQIASSIEYMADYVGSGHFRRYKNVYLSVSDESGRILRVLGRIDDLDDEALRNEMMLRKTHIDPVTGLLNAAGARSIVEQALLIKPANRFDALIIIDPVQFRKVNEKLGREGGDRILAEIGSRIKNFFRADDVVFKYENDLFGVYMRSAESCDNARKKAIALLKDLRAIREPNTGSMKCCAGVAGAVADYRDAEELLNRAIASLNTAKNLAKSENKNA